MIRLSNFCFKTWFQISAKNVRCRYENLKKLTNLFTSEHIVLIADDIKIDSSLFEFLKNNNLEYVFLRQYIRNVEVEVKVPIDFANYVLKEIISNNPENIFVFDLKENEKWKDKLQCTKETIVSRGNANIFVTIACDKNSILLIANKDGYDFKTVYSYLKTNLHD